MIVFDLRCPSAHVFEAWFGSSGDYEDQRARGLVGCPICGSSAVEKAVMAPNIPAKSNSRSQVPVGASEQPSPAAVKAAMAMLAEKQKEMLSSSEWVGRAFAERARAMHQGETEHATIHGQATMEEAKALVEEGVPVLPLPLPVVPPSAQN